MAYINLRRMRIVLMAILFMKNVGSELAHMQSDNGDPHPNFLAIGFALLIFCYIMLLCLRLGARAIGYCGVCSKLF